MNVSHRVAIDSCRKSTFRIFNKLPVQVYGNIDKSCAGEGKPARMPWSAKGTDIAVFVSTGHRVIRPFFIVFCFITIVAPECISVFRIFTSGKIQLYIK